MLGGDTTGSGPAPPADRDQLVGRHHLVERILQTIHNNSLLLQGEHGIGKTTLLRHLERRIRQATGTRPRLCPVLIDLRQVPEERFFLHLREELGRGLGRIGITAEGNHRSGGAPSEHGYRSLLRALRRILGRPEHHGNQLKVVLLIDEIDRLNDYDPRINQRLRALFMKSFADRLVAVVAGERISKQWSSASSPWYNFFEEIEVGPLSSSETEELLRRRLGEPGLVTGAVAARLFQLTGGRPLQLCRCCQALGERRQQDRPLGTEEIEHIALHSLTL